MTEVERLTKIAQKACDETFEKQTEINQLRAEIEKLRHDWAVACKDLGEARADVERLTAVIRRAKDDLIDDQCARAHDLLANALAGKPESRDAEIARLKADNERLQRIIDQHWAEGLARNAEIERCRDEQRAVLGHVEELRTEIDLLLASLNRIANDERNCSEHCRRQARATLVASRRTFRPSASPP